MNIIENIKTRRSCREFALKDVEEEKILTILEAAGWAPSNLNSQPWSFTVVKNAGVKESLKKIVEDTKQNLVDNYGVKWLAHYPVEFLEQVPVFIAVSADPDKAGPDKFMQDKASSHINSCCAAIQNMLLTAHFLGLGSLWFSLMDREAVKALLNIEEKMDLVALVLIGYPAGPINDIPRKPIDKFITYI